jgi:molecular chaperone HtpG
MLLDDDVKDLLPPWAGFAGGVIESNRLTPTASREDLQRDDIYRAVQVALGEALVSGMSEVARTQPDAWRRVIARHNEALLGAALCEDRLFDLLMDAVRIPTSQGDLPICELVSRGRIYVALGDGHGAQEMLFRALKTPVASGDRYAVLPFLRRYVAQRNLTLVEIGSEEGDKNVFTPAPLDEEELKWLSALLCDDEVLVSARFSPLELPLVVVPDREAELKKRLEADDLDKRLSTAALTLVRSFAAKIERTAIRRLYVNVDNPAIAALLAARRHKGAGTDEGIRVLRALKQLMNAGDVAVDGALLNGALQVLSAHTASLLKPRED